MYTNLTQTIFLINEFQTYHWWTMRTLFIHQKMLEERSMTLCDNLQICIDKRKTSINENKKYSLSLF
jgi:hypothetical protein